MTVVVVVVFFVEMNTDFVFSCLSLVFLSFYLSLPLPSFLHPQENTTRLRNVIKKPASVPPTQPPAAITPISCN
jgi:hypothetical protein